MVKSHQRLGDNPRDHDGHFPGLDDKIADVQGARPDADFRKNNPPPSPFEAWKIYPQPPPPHWHWTDKEKVVSGDGDSARGGGNFAFEECTIPDVHPWHFEIDDKGVFQVYEKSEGGLCRMRTRSICSFRFTLAENMKPLFDIPTIREYFVDLDHVLEVISDGPAKSFAFRRLKYLASKFEMYTLLNEYQELADMKVSSSHGLSSGESDDFFMKECSTSVS